MPHAYTEDQLVEQPAIGLFAELGWAVAGPPPNAGVAGEPRDAGLLGRETKGEVVLVSRLRAALERLNPALPPEAITAAVDELTRDRSAMSVLSGQAALPHPASPKGRGVELVENDPFHPKSAFHHPVKHSKGLK